MAKIVINQDEVTEMKKVLDICPFGAIELNNGKLEIGAGCKMCKICVKTGPKGVFEFVEDEVIKIDKDKWKGIAVYVDHHEGDIHPVTFELIGKAKEMAKKINQPVYCIFVGSNLEGKTDALLSYGVDNVFVYDYKDLKEFKIEPYTACVEDFIKEVKPTILLFGGTTIGRSLAPRLAARFKTGLTADCTILDVQENTDLDQIRPAFGGNIMAHIHTPNHRPQFATVRYKIFSAPEKVDHPTGKVTLCNIDENKLKSDIEVLEINNKTKEVGIEDAEVIIVGSRAIKKKEDMEMLYKLADLLGGQVAGTRPLVESGWIDAKKQIGLSGRTVKPKLIITCGVSGAIQFVAGMNGSECIISINKDEKAPIFDTAHYAIVGDVYDVIPRLIKDLELEKTNDYEVMDEVVATLE
ncbi:electron transfer flavoFAD-binding domain protein [[Clostridium] bifermentans ATCC 638]|uniref:Electron transfer flavoFAD-binding domain protein n=1 Tax=Paraclostridium bifermentans ATCC 638 = DSM 14991 TaxID=1233171 RepID=T4VRD9_PARBF|nr:electron transfer flavoprotein subunit alpha/FixB family protein [Paraclostridium bifermentans]EQK43331.1 electron transfer flavoFAD-binding domain protein [[Clostridium] bifermentans ATCC 638] [Paraclostridium bifermentans ATCC 638 = DSM 14991]RIZ60548.1 electron transfer flavoprotein subunit alpha [Paraclostridium bifermentans]UAG17190.1 FAD-binding protein [Paraclostridium bifermentans]